MSATSNVPLRLWIASTVTDASLIQRQWQSGSDQPIEVTSLSADELLQLKASECDIVLFPARLMGDMIHRGWIAKLPTWETEQESQTATSPPSKVALAQTLHNGTPYAISLGCSIPVTIASETMAEHIKASGSANDKPTWQQLVDNLRQEKNDNEWAGISIDEDALVDRFLAILSTLSQRNTKYGLLFEMQTMNTRLTEPEFVAAAEVMLALSKQPGGFGAIVGSHDTAWKWVCESTTPVIAIASPVLIHRDSVAMSTGKMIAMQRANEVRGWNTGGGLVAALSTSCRQTSRSIALLQWLSKNETLAVLSPLIEGVEANTSVAGPESLSSQVRQELADALASDAVPKEPSLPETDRYRHALAQELLRFLKGEKTAPEALTDASQAWLKINSDVGAEQRTNYEKSLGLTL